jgi:four helix bundle protein
VNSDDLKKRTKQFALRILKLAAALPDTTEGKTILGQLVRAGTSVGANYRAACRGRSRAEFIAKIGTVEEESDESAFWLEIIVESAFLQENLLSPYLKKQMSSRELWLSLAFLRRLDLVPIGNRK